MSKSVVAPTPELLRQQASEMLKRAEQLEKNGATRDAIKKALVPALRDVMQAKHSVQTSMDSMLDAVADMEKKIGKLETVVMEVLS
ncbi:MAG: Bacteriophage protein [Hafnia paralvei]